MNTSHKSSIRPWHRLMTMLLVVLLLLTLLPQSAWAEDPVPRGDEQIEAAAPVPECGVGGVIAILIIGTGIYMTYRLYKFCKRVFPDPPPPPPPPPQQTNVVNQTLNGSVTALRKNSGGIQLSESITVTTNGVPEIKLNPADDVVYAIESFGYLAPDGSLYHSYMALKLASSTNLVDWDPIDVKVYVSDTSVLTQVGTNGAVIRPRTETWSLDLDIGHNEPQLFLRSQTVGSP